MISLSAYVREGWEASATTATLLVNAGRPNKAARLVDPFHFIYIFFLAVEIVLLSGKRHSVQQAYFTYMF